MKNTRGEPSAGGQTAPRETLPISCLFVLFRSLRVVRAANIVTMDKPAYVGFGMAFSHPPPRRTLPDSNKYVQKIAKALGNAIASRG